MRATLVLAALLGSSAAASAGGTVTLATCGADRLVLQPGTPAHVHWVANGKTVTGRIAAARVGGKTRTLMVEDVAVAPAGASPSQLFIDLFVADKIVDARHGSEGGADPDVATDVGHCTFDPGLDAALAPLAPAPEPSDCTTLEPYKAQLAKVAKLAPADLDREARALCDDHTKSIAARVRFEQALGDKAAKDRIAARGPNVFKTEQTRTSTWDKIDGCVGAGKLPKDPVARLHETESLTRIRYDRLAPKS